MNIIILLNQANACQHQDYANCPSTGKRSRNLKVLSPSNNVLAMSAGVADFRTPSPVGMPALDKTVPLLEYYADREWIFTVDGAQPPDAVHADIVAGLQRRSDPIMTEPRPVRPSPDPSRPRGAAGRA